MQKDLQLLKSTFRIISYGIISSIILGILLYIAMVIDTNPVKREIVASVKGEIPYEEINKHFELYAYHFSEKYQHEDIGNVYVDVDRKLVLHNWKEGYIWIELDIEVTSPNGEFVREWIDLDVLKIQKADGKWVVVDSRSPMKHFAEVTVPW